MTSLQGLQRLQEVLLLDVGVEGVVHHPKVGVIHLADEPRRASAAQFRR